MKSKDLKNLAKDFEVLIKKYNLNNARLTYTDSDKRKTICELVSTEDKIWIHRQKEIWEKLR